MSVIDPVPSLTARLSLWLRTWAFKAIINLLFSIVPLFAPTIAKKHAPTFTKRYPIRSMLESRFFIPTNYKAGVTPQMPLYINIHGGGFFAGKPRGDDKVCHYICNHFGYVVVSLDYRLAPLYPFPTAVDDCTELVLAILSDTDLPFVDRNRVAVGGQSAGGSLALSIAQDPRLHTTEKIKALVCFYPATDFSHRFTGAYRDVPAGSGTDGKGKAQKDGLRPIVPLAQWSYVPYGQDRTDPRLSPAYADPKNLPSNIYFITAQYDKLCQEAFVMAKRLAEGEGVKEEDNWELRGIRWERLPNEVHGFIEAGWRAELFGGRLPWKQEVEEVLDRVGKWLEHVWTLSQ